MAKLGFGSRFSDSGTVLIITNDNSNVSLATGIKVRNQGRDQELGDTTQQKIKMARLCCG